MRAKRVVVLGAGLSGLAAADALTRAGHEVIVLERQGRVGGRAHSLRDGLAPGLLAEAGPARYPPSLLRVFGMAKRFGLEIEPFYPEFGTVVGYLRGERIERHEPSPEEFWGYTSLRTKYPGRVEGSMIRAALRARRALRRLRGKEPWATFRIGGGTHRLAEALAEASGAEVRLEVTVESVVQAKGHIAVSFLTPDGSGTVDAENVVCALPLTQVPKIEFAPALCEPKRELAQRIPFASAIRVFVQMAKPYWRDQGHNGFAVTDTVGEVWDPHFDAPRAPALLVCYARDDLARSLGRLDEPARLERAVDGLELVFPGARRHAEGGASFYWDEQPWIGGGWPLARHGFSHKVATFREPEGRIYFAGDYAASPDFLNTAEGALESGQHAAEMISRAP